MGVMSIIEAHRAEEEAVQWLRSMFVVCINGSINDFAMCIIVIAQYLYGKYITRGTRLNSSSYKIVSSDMVSILPESYGIYASQLIQLRNKICHHSDYSTNQKLLIKWYSEKSKLIDFVKYLDILPFEVIANL